MTENNNFNNIENDSTNSRNEKKGILNNKTIEFEMPSDGKVPRAMNLILEEWQREIIKILDEANINEVTIRYGDLE